MKIKASTCPLVTDKHLENSGICIDHLKGSTCNLLGLTGYVFGHEVASEKICRKEAREADLVVPVELGFIPLSGCSGIPKRRRKQN